MNSLAKTFPLAGKNVRCAIMIHIAFPKEK
jgi:hypothetical protein